LDRSLEPLAWGSSESGQQLAAIDPHVLGGHRGRPLLVHHRYLTRILLVRLVYLMGHLARPRKVASTVARDPPLTDADLEQPAFCHFFGIGFSTVGAALAGALQHAFSEGWDLRQRLGRSDIKLPESVCHSSVAGYVGLMGSMVDRAAAHRIGHFTMVMDMPGYAGGAWTIRVADGGAAVTEERATAADLVMTLSTDTFMTMFKKVQNPLLLMLTGKIRVRGFAKMGTFGKLFPDPQLDAPLRLGVEAAAAAA
jgi:hypothetical protein